MQYLIITSQRNKLSYCLPVYSYCSNVPGCLLQLTPDMTKMPTSPDDVSTTASDVALDLNDSYDYYYDYYDYDGGDLRFYYVLWTIATPVVFALITVVGVIGNVAVVMVIVTRRSRRRSPTNILLLNLAVADLAFLVVCVPFTGVKYAASSWPLGETACRVANYLLYVIRSPRDVTCSTSRSTSPSTRWWPCRRCATSLSTSPSTRWSP